jgi:hypothetical protein
MLRQASTYRQLPPTTDPSEKLQTSVGLPRENPTEYIVDLRMSIDKYGAGSQDHKKLV